MVNISISYNRLWKLLVDKKMSKADLRRAAEISPNTMTKLRRDEEVSMAGSFTQEDGVTITDTEAPTATLLRDVVKNTVAMFYAAQEPVEEETAVTVAE